MKTCRPIPAVRRITSRTTRILSVTMGFLLLACIGQAGATPFVPERIDSIGPSSASLAIDGYGTPYIVYESNFPTLDLRYAYKTSGGWVFETVDATGIVGGAAAITLDLLGNPHVSYYDETNGNLKYATKSGGVWTVETADGAAANVGLSTSIRVDSQGNPHIAYLDLTTLDLKYAKKAGGVWTIEVVDAAGDTGHSPSLALDSRDNPRIAYWDVTNGDLRYASKAVGAWTLQTGDAAGNVGAEPSLRLDASGNPHISYKDVGNGESQIRLQIGQHHLDHRDR